MKKKQDTFTNKINKKKKKNYVFYVILSNYSSISYLSSYSLFKVKHIVFVIYHRLIVVQV